MAENIVKKERTRKGDEYEVQVRPAAADQAAEFISSSEAALQDGPLAEAHLDRIAESSPAEEDTGEAIREDTASLQSVAERLVNEAQQQAAELREVAESEIEQLKQRTQEELEQQRQQVERDLSEQRSQLEQQVRAELEQRYQERYAAAVSALEQAASKLGSSQAECLKETEQSAFQLTLAIAKQLLGQELDRAPDFIARLITKAFELLKPAQAATVKLAPVTFQRLAEDDLLQSALAEAGISLSLVDLAIDESLSPGQFAVELGGSNISYDLDQALTELIADLEQRAKAFEAGDDEQTST